MFDLKGSQVQLALGRGCGRSSVKLLEVSASINCKDGKGLSFVYNNPKAAEMGILYGE